MIYNELLNKMSSMMTSASKTAGNPAIGLNKDLSTEQVSTPKEDTTSNILNKIGLEIQRQGGY